MTQISAYKIMSKGAEATIGLTKWINKTTILKERNPKRYLDPNLDKMIRSERTKREAKILVTARMNGVPVPTVYYVSQKNGQIIMEYIKGTKLKDHLISVDIKTAKLIFKKIGKYVGILHRIGIIHGDLTTSNIIVNNDGLFIIDYGLSIFSFSEEDRGVDIHLLKRALESTHWEYAADLFNTFIDAYSREINVAKEDIIKKIRDIESRGRYIEKN